MSEHDTLNNDNVEIHQQRLESILNFILCLASGDFDKREEITERGDEFDAMTAALNMLAEEVVARTVSRDYMTNIIESMNEGLMVCNLNGRIETINQATLKIFNVLDKQNIIGQNITDFFTLEKSNKEWVKILLSCQILGQEKEINVQTDTHVHTAPIQFSSSPLIKDNKTYGIVCLIQDIREQKKIEAEKKSIQEQLIQSQKLESIGRLAGGIAHDFNNILAGILGFAENLKLEFKDNPSAQKK